MPCFLLCKFVTRLVRSEFGKVLTIHDPRILHWCHGSPASILSCIPVKRIFRKILGCSLYLNTDEIRRSNYRARVKHSVMLWKLEILMLTQCMTFKVEVSACLKSCPPSLTYPLQKSGQRPSGDTISACSMLQCISHKPHYSLIVQWSAGPVEGWSARVNLDFGSQIVS